MQALETIEFEKRGEIGWIFLNRPEKKNAMNPKMHFEMRDLLAELDWDDEIKVVVLGGRGDSWCAGMDLQEVTRGVSGNPRKNQEMMAARHEWSWDRLRNLSKVTIAMVNGYCFGAAFAQLIACDVAIAADEAMFAISEVNWGAIPAGLLPYIIPQSMTERQALYYMLSGEKFDGRRAAELDLVNFHVPREQLVARTEEIAESFIRKPMKTLTATKQIVRGCRGLDRRQAEEFIRLRNDAHRNMNRDMDAGLSAFLDAKASKPGLG